MELNENCVCSRKNCPRHGKCDECRAYHKANGGIPRCEKKKQRAELKEQRKLNRSR